MRSVPPGPGAIRTSASISRADLRRGRVADAGNGASAGDAVEEAVGLEVAVADDGAGGSDGAGAVTGAGLVADAQATTRRLATIVGVTRDKEACIRCSPNGCAKKRRSDRPVGASRTCRGADILTKIVPQRSSSGARGPRGGDWIAAVAVRRLSAHRVGSRKPHPAGPVCQRPALTKIQDWTTWRSSPAASSMLICAASGSWPTLGRYFEHSARAAHRWPGGADRGDAR